MTKKVFVLHELENDGCCGEYAGHNYTTIHGVFSTEKAAKAFIKRDKYLKYYEVQLTEVELNPKGRFSNV